MTINQIAIKTLQKLFILCLLFATIFTATAINTEAFATINPIVYLNGSKITFLDARPYIDAQGRTQIPVRFIAEKMKYNVQFNEATQVVTIKKAGKTITLKIGSNIMQVSGSKSKTMDTIVSVSEGRTYVPIRYVAEAFSAKVDYNTTTYLLRISTIID